MNVCDVTIFNLIESEHKQSIQEKMTQFSFHHEYSIMIMQLGCFNLVKRVNICVFVLALRIYKGSFVLDVEVMIS